MKDLKSDLLEKAVKGLEEQIDYLVVAFPYLAEDEFDEKPSMEELKRLVFKYCISANDAMIAAFALAVEEIEGLITCDHDYECLNPEFTNKGKNLIIVESF